MSGDRDLETGGVPFGRHPALIVVDMTLGFTSPESPLGGEFDSEVASAVKLVDSFHHLNLPVFFSSVVYRDETTQSVFRQQLPDLNILRPETDWVKVDPRFSLSPSDRIIEKTGPSAFFNTPLLEQMTANGCDSAIVCGLTTSGCVRATVVDALHCNLPAWVVEEGCGDRNHSAHKANLHDMNAKYARVVKLSETLFFLNNL